jgi:TonB family protein
MYSGMTTLKIFGRLLFCLVFVLLLAESTLPASAKTMTLGTEYSSDYKIAEPVFTPHPEISPEFKEECFKSCCIAKFIIKKNGETSVKLLSTSGSPEVDNIAVDTLRRWKFKPAQLDGAPVDSTRRIKVEFEIE